MFLEDMDERVPKNLGYLKEIADLEFKEYVLKDRGARVFKLTSFDIKNLEPILDLGLDIGLAPRFFIVKEKDDGVVIVRRLDGAYVDLGYPLISDYAKLIHAVAIARQIITLEQYFSFAEKYDDPNIGKIELLSVLGLLTAMNLIIYYDVEGCRCVEIL